MHNYVTHLALYKQYWAFAYGMIIHVATSMIKERLLFYKSHIGQTPKNKSRMWILKQFGRPSFYKKTVEKKEKFKNLRSLGLKWV